VPPEALERGVAALRARGFRVLLGEHAGDRRGHLAGEDRDRAADLHAMFVREDVDAVLCARGGSGSIRLLPHLDWDLLAAHPRVFLGYSDVTILQLALLRRCRQPSFFAPMVTPDFAREPSAACVELLRRLACEPLPAGELADPRASAAVTLAPGAAEGPLVGGTLSLVTATLGTPFEIDTDGAVLFLEDVHESPARVERCLAQLLLAGKLERAAGFLLGAFSWEAPEEERARYLKTEEVLADFLLPLGRPALLGWPFGHVPDPVTLPMGIRVRLDAGRKSLEVLEPAVGPPRRRQAGGAGAPNVSP